jgi:hypothetical protein
METENNIKFARFLNFYFSRFENDGIIEPPKGSYFESISSTFSESELKFDSEFNWLMEVVGEIEKLDFYKGSVLIQEVKCTIYYNGKIIVVKQSDNSKIEATNSACGEFLNWYNQQNLK